MQRTTYKTLASVLRVAHNLQISNFAISKNTMVINKEMDTMVY